MCVHLSVFVGCSLGKINDKIKSHSLIANPNLESHTYNLGMEKLFYVFELFKLWSFCS